MLQKLSKCEVKPSLDFVEGWSFYRHSGFTSNQILVNSNGPKMSFVAISETLNFEFLVNLELEGCSNLLKSKLRTSKIAKNDIGPFEFAKIWFHVKSERRLMLKSQQSQALTSHFESFWSIVSTLYHYWIGYLTQ